MSRNLKDEFLRLLREDEEFRLAVIGFLGIVDVQSSLRQLISAVGDLTRTVQRLVEGQERLWEEDRRINENIERLWQEVKALRENQEKLWQENNKLWQEVRRIAEGQEALRTDVNKLWEENNKIWQEIRRINENIERLWQENNRIWREVRLLRRDVGAIRRTLDNLTASIEEEANDVITHLLRRRGVDIRTDRVVLDSRFEFDVYGTNGRLTIVGEAKTRVGPRLIARFDERVGEALRLFPDKFPGRVIKVIYCLRAMPGGSRGG